MKYLNIGNETITITEIASLLQQNISFYRGMIERLDMRARADVRLLCLYSRLIQQQTIMLEWVWRCEQGDMVRVVARPTSNANF